MGTLNEKLEYLSQTKEYIKEAIISKGQPVSSSDTFRSYASKIAAIENGDVITATNTTGSAVSADDRVWVNEDTTEYYGWGNSSFIIYTVDYPATVGSVLYSENDGQITPTSETVTATDGTTYIENQFDPEMSPEEYQRYSEGDESITIYNIIPSKSVTATSFTGIAQTNIANNATGSVKTLLDGNGTYAPTLTSKTITENGTTTISAADNAYGFNTITTNVPSVGSTLTALNTLNTTAEAGDKVWLEKRDGSGTRDFSVYGAVTVDDTNEIIKFTDRPYNQTVYKYFSSYLPVPAHRLEIKCKIKYVSIDRSGSIGFQCYGYSSGHIVADTAPIRLMGCENTTKILNRYINGNQTILTNFSLNTWYWGKFVIDIDNSLLIQSISLDGVTYTDYSGAIPNQLINYLANRDAFAFYSDTNSTVMYDLSECSVMVDGVHVWRPYVNSINGWNIIPYNITSQNSVTGYPSADIASNTTGDVIIGYSAKIQPEKIIRQNGTYTPDAGYDAIENIDVGVGQVGDTYSATNYSGSAITKDQKVWLHYRPTVPSTSNTYSADSSTYILATPDLSYIYYFSSGSTYSYRIREENYATAHTSSFGPYRGGDLGVAYYDLESLNLHYTQHIYTSNTYYVRHTVLRTDGTIATCGYGTGSTPVDMGYGVTAYTYKNNQATTLYYNGKSISLNPSHYDYEYGNMFQGIIKNNGNLYALHGNGGNLGLYLLDFDNSTYSLYINNVITTDSIGFSGRFLGQTSDYKYALFIETYNNIGLRMINIATKAVISASTLGFGYTFTNRENINVSYNPANDTLTMMNISNTVERWQFNTTNETWVKLESFEGDGNITAQSGNNNIPFTACDFGAFTCRRNSSPYLLINMYEVSAGWVISNMNNITENSITGYAASAIGMLATGNVIVGTVITPTIESLNVIPSTSAQTFTPSGIDGYGPVNVSAVDSSIDANIIAGNIKSGVEILGVEGTYAGEAPTLESLIVTPTTSSQTITPTTGVDGYDEITVSPVTASIDPDIVSANIVEGVNILGVNGTAEITTLDITTPRLVVVNNGTDAVAYSDDGGDTWNESELPQLGEWRKVAYGNGRYVAVTEGTNSTLGAYSDDGINWTQVTMPAGNWYDICYGAGKFVSISYNSNILAYSIDGINWTSVTLTNSDNWNSMTYGNGAFVIVGKNYYAYSTDGITWVEDNLPLGNVTAYTQAGDNISVTILQDNTAFAYSEDITQGFSAGFLSSDLRQNWYNLCYGGGTFLATVLGALEGAYITMISSNGTTWTKTGTTTSFLGEVGDHSYDLKTVRYDESIGKFVGLTRNGEYTFTAGTDGIWTVVENDPALTGSSWNGMSYGEPVTGTTTVDDMLNMINGEVINNYNELDDALDDLNGESA